ncbi:MAG TPA: type II secretion system protein [Candidatus Saccharimonadales bacterium]
MGKATQRGFTIIEVMLFLAISGLLAALLMTGWVSRVNTERYRDSVVTLQSFLQQQYNLVYNVENERSSELQCTSDAEAEPGSEPRGQSDCVLLGRFISVKTTGQNGTKLTVQPIIGYEAPIPASPQPSSLLELLGEEHYKAKVTSVDLGLSSSELTVPWGAEFDNENGASFGEDFSIAIIRSPLDGTAHTYATTTSTDDLNTLLTNGTEDQQIDMCLDSGTVFSGQRMKVIIRAFASSQNGVTTEAGC